VLSGAELSVKVSAPGEEAMRPAAAPSHGLSDRQNMKFNVLLVRPDRGWAARVRTLLLLVLSEFNRHDVCIRLWNVPPIGVVGAIAWEHSIFTAPHQHPHSLFPTTHTICTTTAVRKNT